MASKGRQPEQQDGGSDSAAVLEATDGRRFKFIAPQASEDGEVAARDSTDTVEERLAGNFDESIVSEVKKFSKPAWEKPESGLDPIDDAQTFYDYNFKLLPPVHDAYMEVAEEKKQQLEALKRAPSPAEKALIEQRKKLVEGKAPEDLRWLKHKAYYRGIQKVRAAKKQLEQAAEAAEDLQDIIAADTAAAKQHPQQAAPEKRSQEKLAWYSEDEVLAAVSDPSEWDNGWTATSYSQHPEVLQELRSAFAGCLNLPYVSPEEQKEIDKWWEHCQAEQAAKQAQEKELEAARQAFLVKHTPYQAYTPEYLDLQRQQQQLAAHKRHKQQAFWLSLGLAVGSSVVRWWNKRTGGRQQRSRRSSSSSSLQLQQQSGSRRSTRPPTPLLPGSIPE